MKYLLILLLSSIPAEAAITYTGNSGSATGNSASLTVSIPSTTAGNWEGCVTMSSGAINAPTLNGIAFTSDINSVPNTVRIHVYHLENIAGGITSVVDNTASANVNIVCAEFSGLLSSSSADVIGTANSGSSGTTWSSSAVTTLNANDLLFSEGGNESNATSTLTCTNSYTKIAQQQGNGWTTVACYQIVSATGTYTAQGGGITGGNAWDGAQGSYKAAASTAVRHKVTIAKANDVLTFSAVAF
jgi:hypothetical protein